MTTLTPQPSCLVVIPARGGSKGVPRKNLRLVGGIPLITRAVSAVRGAQTAIRVVVSTDDDEIANVAREAGAEIIIRPAAISNDTASSESVILHALDLLRETEGYAPDVVSLVQATSPFILPADVDGAIRPVALGEADTALVVTQFGRFVWRIDESGNAYGINHDKRRRLRRQEREPEYMEAGSIYVMKTDGFRTHEHRFFGRTAVHCIPEIRSMEIDTEEDLIMAEILATRTSEPNHG